ncbi:MAG: glycoside hydrolase family 3 C-terminal domain-containing protein, partial [Streptococcaceae bacterium]|nr:glycoside hydrolase family 3 C-terminal domain-containing protein [Streptococcaceae bacterium]
AYDAAVESIVLLKNEDSALPLKKEEKVVFAGPLVNSQDLLGAWRWQGKLSETESIASLLDRQGQQLSTVEEATKIVLIVGETSDRTGESKSYTNIQLPDEQIKLINKLAKTSKQIILVVLAGRPLDLSAVNDKVSAILYAYFPGTMAARAIVDLLYGKKNPSGKLTMSLPRSVGQIPIYYNNYNTGRPTENESEDYVSRYQDTLKTPLYPFGHGLSYSQFSYSDMAIETNNEKITAKVTVKNQGKLAGATTLLIFIHDLMASTARPLKELKTFEKRVLSAGESQTIHFEIDKEALKFYNFTNQQVFEEGKFEVLIAQSAEDIIYSKIVNL